MLSRRVMLIGSMLPALPVRAAEIAMESELHLAAKANDAGQVKSLIGSGAKIDARDKAQRTPLLAATRANAIGAARALIEAGADVNAKDNIRDTPSYTPQLRAASKFCA